MLQKGVEAGQSRFVVQPTVKLTGVLVVVPAPLGTLAVAMCGPLVRGVRPVGHGRVQLPEGSAVTVPMGIPSTLTVTR